MVYKTSVNEDDWMHSLTLRAPVSRS